MISAKKVRGVLLTVLLVLIGFVPRPIGAQEQCGDPFFCGGEYGHSIEYNEMAPDYADAPEPHHSECLTCEVWNGEDYDPWPWWACHYGCDVFEEEDAAVERMVAAMEAGNVHEALRWAAAAPNRVRLSDARQSIQVLGCDSQIAGNLPLGHHYLAASAALAAARLLER